MFSFMITILALLRKFTILPCGNSSETEWTETLILVADDLRSNYPLRLHRFLIFSKENFNLWRKGYTTFYYVIKIFALWRFEILLYIFIRTPCLISSNFRNVKPAFRCRRWNLIKYHRILRSKDKHNRYWLNRWVLLTFYMCVFFKRTYIVLKFCEQYYMLYWINLRMLCDVGIYKLHEFFIFKL